jgi:hypothetical protein
MPKRKPKKRKPRSKRKIVEPTQPSDIPFQKVRVEWIDILSDSGWADDKQFNKMQLAFPVNEGWLYSKDKDSIKLFASYDKDPLTKEITFGDRTMIPLACVKKMTKVH